MLTKVWAAQRAARSGAHTVIAYGREPDVLLRLSQGEAIGTALRASSGKHAARKRWMADHLQLAGRVRVDAGAQRALCDHGRSLLPVGVQEVMGDFHRGDVIAVLDAEGRELARGLSNYASAEARLLAGHASADIESLLGYVAEPELIHRDNLVLSR
jgi:glutamate 5-kinase